MVTSIQPRMIMKYIAGFTYIFELGENTIHCVCLRTAYFVWPIVYNFQFTWNYRVVSTGYLVAELLKQTTWALLVDLSLQHTGVITTYLFLVVYDSHYHYHQFILGNDLATGLPSGSVAQFTILCEPNLMCFS